TLFWVGKTGTAATEVALFGVAGASHVLFQNGSPLSAEWFEGVALSGSAANMNNPHIFGIDINGASSKVYQDSSSSAILSGNAGTASSPSLTVGGYSTAQFAGRVVEVIFYNARIAASDFTKVVNYLGARYGITVTRCFSASTELRPERRRSA